MVAVVAGHAQASIAAGWQLQCRVQQTCGASLGLCSRNMLSPCRPQAMYTVERDPSLPPHAGVKPGQTGTVRCTPYSCSDTCSLASPVACNCWLAACLPGAECSAVSLNSLSGPSIRPPAKPIFQELLYRRGRGGLAVRAQGQGPVRYRGTKGPAAGAGPPGGRDVPQGAVPRIYGCQLHHPPHAQVWKGGKKGMMPCSSSQLTS